jgi:hypothetical protein
MAYLVFGVALGVVVGGWLLFRGKHQHELDASRLEAYRELLGRYE